MFSSPKHTAGWKGHDKEARQKDLEIVQLWLILPWQGCGLDGLDDFLQSSPALFSLVLQKDRIIISVTMEHFRSAPQRSGLGVAWCCTGTEEKDGPALRELSAMSQAAVDSKDS